MAIIFLNKKLASQKGQAMESPSDGSDEAAWKQRHILLLT